jgi:hypothetical protein
MVREWIDPTHPVAGFGKYWNALSRSLKAGNIFTT